ncbi:choice-of-anchor L domain-containing protein [Flavobacterium sp.]|uniref:choice-of-anchor L domain-containing protein n=1 Tax=Flavobacterium sp. TaxID=239 RepID=UPI00286BD890|nr:choice-of-anchor L domain-containing protein [Flavobacterium sp.]
MNCTKVILSVFFFCCNLTIARAQYITVDDTKTAQQLVENILVNSSCATVSNFTVNGDTFTSGKNSYGYFNAGTSTFPFAEGVVLNTWSADKTIGPFVAGNNGGGSQSWTGDADLNQALGINSVNATSLEFDFTPLTNFISFNYIFASNEYQGNFPCNYSDGFAFLIKVKGSTANYQNLALVPGTTTPVSSVNVRPTIPASGAQGGCPALNQIYFNGFNTAANPTNFGGQTVVMNAQSTVIAGTTYHIKLVMADDQTRFFDSAVFLQAGSFAPKINLGQDRLLVTNNPVCFGQPFVIDTQLPTTYGYKWFKNNSEIIGETNPFYQAIDAGDYKVEITLSPSTCMAIGQIKIEYTPEIILSNSTLIQCDDNGDGKSVFDLTRIDNLIKNNDTSLSPVVYYETLPEAKLLINPILNPTTYTNKIINQILYARVTNSYGCVNYAELNLKISNNIIAPQNPISICDGDSVQDGLSQFDLNLLVTPQVLMGLPTGLLVEYYLNSSDAVLQKNPLANNFSNTAPNQQIIYARIVNGSNCYGLVPITLVVNPFSPPNFQTETAIVCENATIPLSVPLGYSSYLWNTGSMNNTIIVKDPGSYTVTVTNANGCKATKTFTVTASGIATITGTKVNDFAGNNNSVLIEFTGIGNYEFSLDNSYFQDSPQFDNVAPGYYVAYAKDKKGCGLSNPFVVYVLDYPRFFTPNQDGFNDFWEIKNLNLFPNATLTIFDRYGKLLKQLYANSSSWDGTLEGIQLPSNDYWFQLNFKDGKIIKGHFSLKR